MAAITFFYHSCINPFEFKVSFTFFCQTHLLVLSALLTSKPAYGIYFLRNPTSTKNDDYSAIVGIKEEQRLDSYNRIQVVYSPFRIEFFFF
jgi:hypothetical protein